MSNLITRFNNEVIKNGPESTLPVNLSNEWLNILETGLEKILESEEELKKSENFYMSIALLAILHILTAKNSDREEVSKFNIPMEQLFKYFQDYMIELTIESISRKTEMKGTPATIQTIFTERQVEFTEVY